MPEPGRAYLRLPFLQLVVCRSAFVPWLIWAAWSVSLCAPLLGRPSRPCACLYCLLLQLSVPEPPTLHGAGACKQSAISCLNLQTETTQQREDWAPAAPQTGQSRPTACREATAIGLCSRRSKKTHLCIFFAWASLSANSLCSCSTYNHNWNRRRRSLCQCCFSRAHRRMICCAVFCSHGCSCSRESLPPEKSWDCEM